MPKIKTLTLRGITFEVADEQARNDIQTLSNTVDAIPTPIQADLSQNDSTAADYVKNRTHYEAVETVNEPLNITWDGNTEGLVSVADVYYKVSDLVFTDEEIKLMTLTTNNDSTPEIVLADMWENGISWGQITLTDDLTAAFYVIIARKDGAVLSVQGQSVTFPEKGIYFANVPDSICVTSLTTTEPVPQTKTVVHKLDKKYLPDVTLPIIYVVDASGEEIVCSCSVDINTVLNSCFSAPISVKIFREEMLYEAYEIKINMHSSTSLEVAYKYDRLEEGVSEFIVHDSEGVRIGEPV